MDWSPLLTTFPVEILKLSVLQLRRVWQQFQDADAIENKSRNLRLHCDQSLDSKITLSRHWEQRLKAKWRHATTHHLRLSEYSDMHSLNWFSMLQLRRIWQQVQVADPIENMVTICFYSAWAYNIFETWLRNFNWNRYRSLDDYFDDHPQVKMSIHSMFNWLQVKTFSIVSNIAVPTVVTSPVFHKMPNHELRTS